MRHEPRVRLLPIPLALTAAAVAFVAASADIQTRAEVARRAAEGPREHAAILERLRQHERILEELRRRR